MLAAAPLLLGGAPGCRDCPQDAIDLVMENGPTAADLRGIAYAEGVYFAVGEHGTLLKRDVFKQWMPVASPVTVDLFDVAFSPNFQSVIAVGDQGSMIRHTTAGDTWSSVDSGVTNSLHAVAFVSDSQVVAVGSGAAIYSVDAGLTWLPGNLPEGGALRLKSVAVRPDRGSPADQVVLAVGDRGAVILSQNGGVDWTPVDVGTGADLNAVGMHGDSLFDSFVISGADGTLLRELDPYEGMGWVPIDIDSTADFTGLSVSDHWMVADDGAVRTSNGSLVGHFSMDTAGKRGPLFAIDGDDSVAIAVGSDGQIVRAEVRLGSCALSM